MSPSSAALPDARRRRRTLAALADPVRRRSVELLAERPRRAGELAEALGVSAPVMSRHLRVLRAPTWSRRSTRPSMPGCGCTPSGPRPWVRSRAGSPTPRRFGRSSSARSRTTWSAGEPLAGACRAAGRGAHGADFTAFTGEIGQWWCPNGLFRFTDRAGGRLAFEPDPPERLVEIGIDGERFEIGPVTVWDPPHRLVFGWRQAGFPAGRSTEVSVRFDAGGERYACDRRALRLGRDSPGPRCPPWIPADRVSATARGVVAGRCCAGWANTSPPESRRVPRLAWRGWPPDPANTSSPRPAAMPVRPRPRRRHVSRATRSAVAPWSLRRAGARSPRSPPTRSAIRTARSPATDSTIAATRCSSSASWPSTPRT